MDRPKTEEPVRREKENMDAPQEEFIGNPSFPSPAQEPEEKDEKETSGHD